MSTRKPKFKRLSKEEMLEALNKDGMLSIFENLTYYDTLRMMLHVALTLEDEDDSVFYKLKPIFTSKKIKTSAKYMMLKYMCYLCNSVAVKSALRQIEEDGIKLMDIIKYFYIGVKVPKKKLTEGYRMMCIRNYQSSLNTVESLEKLIGLMKEGVTEEYIKKNERLKFNRAKKSFKK